MAMWVQVTVWFPAQFAELRRICLRECGGEAAFCASLSRCHRSAFASCYGLSAHSPAGLHL